MCNNKSSFVGKYMATKKLRLQICFAFEALSGSCSCVFLSLRALSFSCIHAHTYSRTYIHLFSRSHFLLVSFLSDIIDYFRSHSLFLSLSLLHTHS